MLPSRRAALHNQELLNGVVGRRDAERASMTLTDLAPYLDLSRVVVGGGLAVRYLTHHAGQSVRRWPLSDLDLNLEGLDALKPSVADRFVIGHTHADESDIGQSCQIVLVDPKTGLTVDVFVHPKLWPTEIVARLGDLSFQMIEPHQQLALTIRDIALQVASGTVHPKRILSALALAETVEELDTEVAWQQSFGREGSPFAALVRSLAEVVRDQRELVSTSENRRQLPDSCTRCSPIDGFPVANNPTYLAALAGIRKESAVQTLEGEPQTSLGVAFPFIGSALDHASSASSVMSFSL